MGGARGPSKETSPTDLLSSSYIPPPSFHSYACQGPAQQGYLPNPLWTTTLLQREGMGERGCIGDNSTERKEEQRKSRNVNFIKEKLKWWMVSVAGGAHRTGVHITVHRHCLNAHQFAGFHHLSTAHKTSLRHQQQWQNTTYLCCNTVMIMTVRPQIISNSESHLWNNYLYLSSQTLQNFLSLKCMH